MTNRPDHAIIKTEKRKGMNKMKYIQNIECGNIYDATTEGLQEARKEAEELYDVGDPTNPATFWDYYEIIEVN